MGAPIPCANDGAGRVHCGLRPLRAAPHTKRRYSDVSSAIAAAAVGEPLLVLAMMYPSRLTPITPAHYAEAAAKRLRVYVEFPAALPPGSALNESTARVGTAPLAIDQVVGASAPGDIGTLSRLVSTRQLGQLEPLRIMAAHGAVVLPLRLLAPLPPARPCLPVSNGTGRLVGTALAWSFVSHDEALCALEPNGSRTLYTGHICASDGSIMWDNFSTPGRSVKRGAKTLQCAWSCGSEPEYCGVGCGMSQRDAVRNPALPAKVCAKRHGSTSVQAHPGNHIVLPLAVHVVSARVAGYDSAVFGIPANTNQTQIILFSATESVLVSTTKLSNLITARYVHYTARILYTVIQTVDRSYSNTILRNTLTHYGHTPQHMNVE